MYEYTKRKLALELNHLELLKKQQLEYMPYGYWNSDSAENTQEKINEIKQVLHILDPNYDYAQERFTLDFLYHTSDWKNMRD